MNDFPWPTDEELLPHLPRAEIGAGPLENINNGAVASVNAEFAGDTGDVSTVEIVLPEETDIEMVMSQTAASRADAIRALQCFKALWRPRSAMVSCPDVAVLAASSQRNRYC